MSPKVTLKFSPISNSALARLLSKHDDRRQNGFITHLDRAPLSHKRKAFVRGLLMNLGLIGFIAWLVSAIITQSVYSPTPTPVMTALCVTQDLIIAWAIYSILITTTIPFFMRECRLRLRCGFRPTEVVFRKPPVLSTNLSDEERAELYRRFVTRSMDPHLIYASFWSFLTSELWVSEHLAIMEAHDLIDKGDIDEGSLESALLRQENGTWSICEICKTDNMV
ncbi:hypothetical protein BDZ94DRAFT_1319703 [Collybia nuda]|uniref:Uncharacterized protein n=1 Tax=Collybia nuda TaxID=64659 RepID=A0A9P5YDV4_9AGAR|nr:hypothetical protein BDZ94DRAFT_1319703 [Collybia nuda]